MNLKFIFVFCTVVVDIDIGTFPLAPSDGWIPTKLPCRRKIRRDRTDNFNNPFDKNVGFFGGFLWGSLGASLGSVERVNDEGCEELEEVGRNEDTGFRRCVRDSREEDTRGVCYRGGNYRRALG